MIPAYYHENGGIVMGNMRGLGNATPLRLVSPAPVMVNPGSAGEEAPHWAVANTRTNEAIAFLAGNGVRLLNSQPQPIQTPPASLYSATQPPSLYSSTSGSGTPIGGQYHSLERDLCRAHPLLFFLLFIPPSALFSCKFRPCTFSLCMKRICLVLARILLSIF